MKPLAQSAIRKQNIRSILRLLTLHSPRTRQSLAEATGLSLMSVSNLVDQLKACQVLELLPMERPDTQKPASGRKAENISLSGAHHAWLMLDLSGKAFHATLLGFDLSVLWERSSVPAADDYVHCLSAFLKTVRLSLPQVLSGRALQGVAVVTPGPYDVASDTVHNQRLRALNGVHIKQLLQRELGDYPYCVDEDVKFAVRAFSPLIEQEQCELLYYLFIGEGVGGAAVHGGNLLRGLNATAGDAGQLLAPCGETYENLLSLSAFAASLHCMGEDADRLSEQLQLLSDDAPEAYRSTLQQAAQTTADMLSGVLWVLDPSHIVIDCRYAAPFESAYIDAVCRALQVHFSASNRALPVIMPAPGGMRSVLRGAVQALQQDWVERIVP